MKIRDFKKLGLRMLMNSLFTSFFITTICLLVAGLVQIDFTPLIKINPSNLTTANIFDQLFAALTNGLNNNIFSGLLASNLNNLMDLATLAFFSVVFFIVIYSVLCVGRDAYFLQARAFKIKSDLLLYGYDKKIYRKIILAQAIRYGKILLGSLCLIVPGVYFHYKYRMLNYVMAQYPEKGIKEYFEINDKITNGRIWFFFLMDVSFIGWRLLNLITLNLMMYAVEPYYQATYCELYVASHQAVFHNNGYGHNPLITVELPTKKTKKTK